MSKDKLKKLADKMMQNKIKVLGVVFKTHMLALEKMEGENAPRQIEKTMADCGYPMKFKEMSTFEFYPIGLADLIIVAAKEIFHWSDNKVFEMGKTVPQYSFIVKTIMRYFLTPKKCFEQASNYWEKHFTGGTLTPYFFAEGDKKVVLHLNMEVTAPALCVFYAGYFLRIAEMVINGKGINIQETKCAFKGSPYHEFVITWK